MKTILVTGGGGFVGSNLVAALIARGSHDIVVCDHFGTGDKWRNLAKHHPYELITPAQLFDWLEANHASLEMVYHLGSISSTTEQNLDLVLEHNLQTSIRLWRWCHLRSKRLVYASAAATYGDGANGFDDTLDLAYLRRLEPLSGYGWSKHLFDVHVATAASRGQIALPQWAGLKFFNMYGPNEYHKGDQQSVITKIASHAIQAGRVNLFRSYDKNYANGEQKRDVIYVKDVVRVMLWLLDKPTVSGLFNVGTGKPSTFNEMANSIFAALGRKSNIHYVDMPEDLVAKYQYFTQARMDRLLAAGYDGGFMSLSQGITDYVQNYLTKEDHYL
ncbi:MAG: ADP-glyceromanno-heptose 6-epimerase [Alphaproteobacteria bacterium]|nr:ADP-glyceromanno-heptose 6-epimerase [Alphaproteobacteria bacterium]